MKTYTQLTETEKNLIDVIVEEALSLAIEEVKGYNFIRINMYKDAVLELREKGETELKLCGAHTFSASNWDDIDKTNQFEIFNFQQDSMKWVEGGGDWKDTDRGQRYIKEAEYIITENVIKFFDFGNEN